MENGKKKQEDYFYSYLLEVKMILDACMDCKMSVANAVRDNVSISDRNSLARMEGALSAARIGICRTVKELQGLVERNRPKKEEDDEKF